MECVGAVVAKGKWQNNKYFYHLHQPFCEENITNILNCNYAKVSTQKHCSSNFGTSLVCLRHISENALSNCTDGSIRLSSNSNKGRLEICQNSVWGSVCYSRWYSSQFSIHDANVACRMLGYQALGLYFRIA